MRKRIGLIGLYHESNTFVPQKTVLDNFKSNRYFKGQTILDEYRTAHHELGGMIEVLEKEGQEIVPIFYAEATPSGTISSEAFEYILNDMMDEVDKVLPLDAIMVGPHGAGVSEDFRDMDGRWLSVLREKVGPEIPLVGTLDLHANVSPLMVSATDALVSYKQNPHVDQRDRGKEAASLLLRHLKKEIRLKQVLTQVPLSISIEQQFTSAEPCVSLYAYANKVSDRDGIVSHSILHGFPYADVEDMGTSIIVVSDNQPELAGEVGKKIAQYITGNKEKFVGEKFDAAESVNRVRGIKERPVLLLDMGDNVGGGGPANNICILKELEKSNDLKYFFCLFDPVAVKKCEQFNPGDKFDLTIEGTDGNRVVHDLLNVSLVSLNDGRFKESQPRHGGQINYMMGRTAIVSPREGCVIMLTSLRIVPFSLQQLLTFNVDPTAFDAIVAKGVNAPIAAYAPVCPTILQVNTPGVTQADMTKFTYHYIRRPIFPIDLDI